MMDNPFSDSEDDDVDTSHMKRSLSEVEGKAIDTSSLKKKPRLVDDEAQQSDDIAQSSDEEQENKDNAVEEGNSNDDFGSDSDKEVQQKRKLHKLKKKKTRILEAEDLELLEENIIQNKRNEIAPESVREEDGPIEGGDSEADDTAQAGKDALSGDDDSVDDFIDDGPVDDNGTNDTNRPLPRPRRVDRERSRNLYSGPLREHIDEAREIFGEDYNNYLDEDEEEDDIFGDEEKESKRLQILRSKIERSQLVEAFETDIDEELRTSDR
jgi:hypothetical protein